MIEYIYDVTNDVFYAPKSVGNWVFNEATLTRKNNLDQVTL